MPSDVLEGDLDTWERLEAGWGDYDWPHEEEDFIESYGVYPD